MKTLMATLVFVASPAFAGHYVELFGESEYGVEGSVAPVNDRKTARQNRSLQRELRKCQNMNFAEQRFCEDAAKRRSK